MHRLAEIIGLFIEARDIAKNRGLEKHAQDPEQCTDALCDQIYHLTCEYL